MIKSFLLISISACFAFAPISLALATSFDWYQVQYTTFQSEVVPIFKEKDGKERPNSNMADAHAEVEVIQKAYDQGLTQGRDMNITVEGEPICTYCRSDIRDMADEAGLNSVSVTHNNQDGVSETVTWSRNEDGTMGRRPTVTPVE